MRQDYTQFCGVDVSKSTLDYIVLKSTDDTRIDRSTIQAYSKKFHQIPNTLDQINERFKNESFENTLFIVESTGSYSSKIIHQLNSLNRSICIVSPYRSKCYMAAKGITNKNDKNAALSLAVMGKNEQLRSYQPPTPAMQEHKQILSTYQALQKQQRMLSNQIHALEQYPIINSLALKTLEEVLQKVEEELKKLESQLYDPLKDPAYDEKLKYGVSVKGIGEKTAHAILLATQGLEGFESVGAVVKFLGIIPSSHESGSSVRRKGRMTKFGKNTVRGSLYMCTRSAIQYNKACKDLYERLRRRGKPHKVAAVAVMHKLIKQFYVCVTQKRMFDNDFYTQKKNQNKK